MSSVVPNLMYATGHFRNGVLLAPLTAHLVADAMRALHAKQAAVKFFGSWPRVDHLTRDARAHADERWRLADDWIAGLRDRIAGD